MPSTKNKFFYSQAIKRYGISAQGVHWNSKYSQYKRFDIITACIKKELPQSTLVDAGCGFGEYYCYLEKNQLPFKSYIGLDCEEEMIEIAQERYPHLRFLLKDILTDELISADYYVCSGAMNLLNQRLFFQFVLNMWKASEKGLVFNFLKKESFNHINPQEVIEFCRNLSQELIIEENYLSNDMTLFLKR